MSYHKQDWSNGWAVITEDKRGIVESPELVLIYEGKYADLSGISKTKKKNMINIPSEITIKYKLD